MKGMIQDLSSRSAGDKSSSRKDCKIAKREKKKHHRHLNPSTLTARSSENIKADPYKRDSRYQQQLHTSLLCWHILIPGWLPFFWDASTQSEVIKQSLKSEKNGVSQSIIWCESIVLCKSSADTSLQSSGLHIPMTCSTFYVPATWPNLFCQKKKSYRFHRLASWTQRMQTLKSEIL